MFLDEQAGRITFEKPEVIKRTAKAKGVSEKLAQDFARIAARPIASPIEKDGVNYISAFIRTTDRTAVSELEALGVEIQCEFLDGKLFTALIPVDMIGKISDIAKVTRISVATKKIAFTNTAREKTNVDDVLVYSTDARNSGLPNSYDGSGVIMGVIDTGIDFNHVAFKDASGNSRIKQAYVYNGSTERTYTGSQITSSLTDDNSEDHGTHTSSTAGGSSVKVSGTTVTVTNDHSSATYGGMAPGSDLYLAGINGLNDTYLANAFQNICNYADQNNQPVVVSNSWGSQMGPHDGTGEFADICAQYFSDSNPNHICLFAASNDAGGNGFHVRGTASSSSPLGSVVSPYNISGYNLYLGIFANAWTRSTGSTLSCRVHVINSSGSIVKSVDVNPNSGSYTTVNIGSTYIYSGSLIAYRDYVDSEKSQIVLRGYGDSYGIGGLLLRSGYRLAVQFYPSNGSSEIDIWGGSSYNSFVNTPSVSGYTWTAGTDDGCYSDEATIPTAISIGAYASKNGGSNTSYTIGDIADFSSWGTAANSPTGEFYPWITAPGARLIAGVNHNHTSGDYSYYDGVSADMVVNSSTNPYAYMEGTSMATPTAAGIVALWLQVAKDNNIELTTSDIKTIMKETAITDSYTNGTNASHFGNGKIDALAGIKYILDNYVQNDNPTITATPTSIDFGNVTAGTTTTQTFTVTGENLEGNISLSKSGNNYTIDKTSISKNSDGSASATVIVTFAPTANVSQTYTGTVTLTSSNASSVTVSLTGKGVYTAPAITASPTSLSFTGNSGTTYTKTVTVTGTNLQGNITAAISGDANGFYSVSPTTITSSNGSASSTVTVTWAPTTGGTSTANLVLTTTGTGANTVTVPITGTAQGPTIAATPTSVTFTDAYATRTYTQTVTVTGTNLSQNITASLSGANVYSIDKNSLGTSGGTITVTYAPTAAGTTNATLTLSSTGASSVTVPITGTAQAATPTLVVSPASLTFSTDLENSQQQTFAVTGRFIDGAVNVALTDANGVFTVSPTSIPAASISETTPVNVTVTFQSATEGSYTGTITLTSDGAESKTVTLNATANDGGTASDAYLDIAKYATIDEAGWNTTYVNKLYKFTEYDEEAWLTLPIYGAWSSIYYSPKAQNWVQTNVTTNSNTYAGATWNSNDKLLGSSEYFTSSSGAGSARVMGYNSRQNYTQETVSFFVTNTTAVQMLGLGQSRASSSYPATLKVFECTKNADGTVTAGTTAVKSYSNSATSGTFVLSATDLDETKIYKVEAATYRSYIAEIGFKTPLNKPSLNVAPTELSMRAAPGETTTATFNVKGRLLNDNVIVTLNDQNGVFAVNPASISISDALAGSDVTVSFSSETEGTFTGTVTVASGDLVETITLIGVSADGGTASDAYLNIAKYATIDAAGWPTSSIANLYQYKEYAEDNCAWLTVANYGVNIASNTQKWFTPNTIKNSTGSWNSTDIFFGDDTYFGASGTSYYANWTEDYQDFYVTNCTLVKQYAYNSSSYYPLIMTIYECTENADGTLTAGTTPVQTINSSVYSATELITSSTLDASKIYKIRIYNDYSRLYEIGFRTPLTSEATLAQIESEGYIGNRYTVSDELVAVDYAIVDDAIYLWCKDQGNASIAPAPAVGDKIDYLRNDQYAQNDRAWDESNWVALKFSVGSVQTAVTSITSAKGHKINAGTITGVYSDATNYTIAMPEGEGLPTGAVGDEFTYTPNVYCVANFNPAYLTEDGAQLKDNGNVYFFMTPKVQEVCEITYAYWNAENFIVPTTSGFVGSLSLDWTYNETGNVTSQLNADNIYRFKTIVQRTGATTSLPALKAEGGAYKVAPLNLTSTSKADIPTAIGTVKAGVDVVDVYYVNSTGLMSKTPFQGVNIIVTRYSDGSRTTVKKVFK